MIMKRFIAPRFKVIFSLYWDQPPWCCRLFNTYCARSAAVHLAVRTFSEGGESESCRATLTFLTEREREPARWCSKQQISQLYNTAYRCRVCRGSSSDGQDENDHKSLQRTLYVWRFLRLFDLWNGFIEFRHVSGKQNDFKSAKQHVFFMPWSQFGIFDSTFCWKKSSF